MQHAAQGVGPVFDRAGPPHDLDALEHERIEVPRRRTRAPLRGHTRVVDQQQGSPAGEPTQRRYGVALTFVDPARARNLVENAGEARGVLLFSLFRSILRRRRGGRGPGRRRDAGPHGHVLMRRGGQPQSGRLRGSRRDPHDAQEGSALVEEGEIEGGQKVGVEVESALGVGRRGAGAPDDRHGHAGGRATLVVDEAEIRALRGRGGRAGDDERGEDDGAADRSHEVPLG